MAEDFKAAGVQQLIEVRGAEVDQVARDVDAVPAFAEEQELPAGGVGNLDDQAAVGCQQAVRGFEIRRRVMQVFQHVEHRDGGARSGGEGRLRERSAGDTDLSDAPGGAGGIEREVESHKRAGVAGVSTLPQQLQEEASTAADVQHCS